MVKDLPTTEPRSPDRQRSEVHLRFGQAIEVKASVDVSSAGLLAITALVSGILLSTTVLVRSAARGQALSRMAMMKTDIEPEGIPSDMPLAAIKIETIEDYENATARVADLGAVAEGSPGARELEALFAAIMEWDKRADDATAWS